MILMELLGTQQQLFSVYAWKDSLGFQDVSQIQQVCREPMGEIGYRLLTNETQMISQEPTLEKTADEVWPFLHL